MGIAIMSVSTSEATFMPKVSGSRSTILSHTGRWSLLMDRPKSRRTSRDSQPRYCSCNGRSSP